MFTVIAIEPHSNKLGSTMKNPRIDMIAIRPVATNTKEYPANLIAFSPMMSSVIWIQKE